jgi:hypothetical protein
MALAVCASDYGYRGMIANPIRNTDIPDARLSRLSAELGHATHEVKSWPEFFEPMIQGLKSHDLRRTDDRNFNVGDHLRLREFDPRSEKYTGRACTVEITYITSSTVPCAYFEAAIDPLFCVLSVRLLSTE